MEALTIHDTITRDGTRFLGFDLYDILALESERVASSTWLCEHVECIGPASDELHAVSEAKTQIPGSRLLDLAQGIQQTIDGDFGAYLTSHRPWCVIRAIDGEEFVVISDYEAFLAKIRGHFRDVRESPEDVAYVG